MSKKQKKVKVSLRKREFGSKFLDLANFAISGIVFTNFITDKKINLTILLIGIMIYISFAFFGYLLLGETTDGKTTK
jgi:hypothetical protein